MFRLDVVCPVGSIDLSELARQAAVGAELLGSADTAATPTVPGPNPPVGLPDPLAKAEIRREGTRPGKAAGLFGGAGGGGYLVLLFLSLAIWGGLSNVKLGEVAGEVKDNLRQPVREATDSARHTRIEAARHVRNDSRTARRTSLTTPATRSGLAAETRMKQVPRMRCGVSRGRTRRLVHRRRTRPTRPG